MPGADGMSSKFMKNAFVGWTFTAGLYYPPDFDASKLMPMKMLKPKGQKEQVMNIRMMFPFTMICDACKEYNYTGTKFTAKVEQIKHESYLGLKVYRFYGRCRHCWSEFTFKTDPKNSDYTMESGGKRTYEAWKDADMMEQQLKEEQEKEREQDQMKALEQKSIDVQAEMQRLEDLDAIRTMNKRAGARDQTIEEALDFIFNQRDKEAAAEEKLGYGEQQELAQFREAQEAQKRQKLDDEVEGPGDSPATSSSALLGSAAASSSSSSAAPGGLSATLASAVAERAASSSGAGRRGAGAIFSVKRKAAPDEEPGGDAKRPCGAAGNATAAAGSAAGSCSASSAGAGAVISTGASGSGGLGLLGSYDSDEST